MVHVFTISFLNLISIGMFAAAVDCLNSQSRMQV